MLGVQASQSAREGLVAHMQAASKDELMKRLQTAAALLEKHSDKHCELLSTQSALRDKHHRAEVGAPLRERAPHHTAR